MSSNSLKDLGFEEGSKWGLISYDIPTDEDGNTRSTASKLPELLRRLAVRINLSVWVFQPVNRNHIEKVVSDLRESHPEDMEDVWVLPFAVSTDDEEVWNQMVEANVKKMIAKIPSSFSSSMEHLKEKFSTLEAEDTERKLNLRYNRIKSLIEDAQFAIASFSITGNVESLLKAAVSKVEAMFAEAQLDAAKFYVSKVS